MFHDLLNSRYKAKTQRRDFFVYMMISDFVDNQGKIIAIFSHVLPNEFPNILCNNINQFILNCFGSVRHILFAFFKML